MCMAAMLFLVLVVAYDNDSSGTYSKGETDGDSVPIVISHGLSAGCSASDCC